MIDRKTLQELIAKKAEVSFSRSGGKGGQNVNKVNTKVLAAIKLDSLSRLTDEERTRLKTRLAARLTVDGELYVQVQEARTQGRNLAVALERLTDLIMAALRVPKKRKKTRPPAGAREDRLKKKKRRTEKKRLRRGTREED
jgi:ribosome-associated protein